jgi:NAD(P)-dependent dehydrogenase (short-subunit alcohol dehydrogenase family)
MSNSRWDVKLAIVSGAASGIGSAVTRALLEDGSSVIAVDLNMTDAAVAMLEQACHNPDQKVVPVSGNVADAPGLRSLISAAVAEHGQPDFALNCAGINRTGNFEKISDEDYTAVITVNLLGSRNFARAVLPHMAAGSQFALLASLGGLVANYAYSAYSASKFGVVGLAEVLRVEYKPLGIGVSVICPPEIPTPMVEAEMKDMHPAQRALKDTGGLVELEDLVPYLLNKSVRDKQYMIIPGARARLTSLLFKLLPSRLIQAYTDSVVKKVFVEHPDAPKR